MEGPISVTITGAKDSEADYDDENFNRADERFRQAVADFYDAGAKIDNIEEAISGALEDADAHA